MKKILTIVSAVSIVGAAPAFADSQNLKTSNVCMDAQLRPLVGVLTKKLMMSKSKGLVFQEAASSFADLQNNVKNYAKASTSIVVVATLGAGFAAGTAALGGTELFLGGTGVGAGLWNAFIATPAFLFSGISGAAGASIPLVFGIAKIEKTEDAISMLEQAKETALATESQLAAVVYETKSGITSLHSFLTKSHEKIDVLANDIERKIPGRFRPMWFLSLGWADVASVRVERVRAEAHAELYLQEAIVYNDLLKWAKNLCESVDAKDNKK